VEELDQEEQEEYLKALNNLEKNAQVEDVQNHEGWKIFETAWRHVAELSKKKLATINPDDRLSIIKLQVNVNFYENVLKETINNINKAATNSYEFAYDKGWLQEMGSHVTQRKFRKNKK